MDFKDLVPLIIQGSMVLIVASAGLQARWSDVQAALRHPGLVARAVVAVNVAVPLVAILACLVLPMATAIKAGIVIMAVSPLAPFVPAKLLKGGTDASLAVGLFFILLLLAVLIVPATFALLSAALPSDATIPVGVVARFVLLTLLLPLLAGLLVAEMAPGIAPRLAKIFQTTGFVLLVPVLIGMLYKAGGPMLSLFGDGTVLAIVAAVTAGLVAGHLLGGPGDAGRVGLASVAAARHPGLAGLVAQRHYDDPRVMLTVLLFLFLGIIVSAVYQAWVRKRLARAPAAAPTEAARDDAPWPRQ